MGRLAFCSNGSFVWAGRVFDLLRFRDGAFFVPSFFVFAIYFCYLVAISSTAVVPMEQSKEKANRVRPGKCSKQI